jgi:hypothetical protein
MTADLSSSSASLECVLNRLAEPQIVNALNTLLDHADLIALSVVALDGVLRRSEEIGDAVTTGIDDLRQVAATVRPPENFAPGEVLTSLVEISMALPRVTPAITRVVESGLVDTVLDSGITSPAMVEQISRIGRGLASASEDHRTNPQKVPGAFGMLRLLKDPDINRGLGFMVAVLRAIGRELDDAETDSPGRALNKVTK